MNSRKLNKAIKRLKHLPLDQNLLFYSINKLRHFLYKIGKSTKVAYPSTIMLELTNHCNLHCTTCPRVYDFGKQMDKGHIRLDQAKKIIDELWPYLDSIGLTGMGETFMFKEIGEIVDYIKSKNKGIITSISTNAMLPGFLGKAADVIGKLDTIQVSIDGLDDIYEGIRVNANFNLLDSNLQKLAEMCKGTDTAIMLNMVVTKENYHQMTDIIEYSRKTGIKYLNFTLLNLAAVTDISIDYYQFYKSAEFLSEFNKVEAARACNTDVIISNWNFESRNEFKKCSFPWSHFYICWNGYVTPCCSKPFPKELNFGNVFDNGVMNVLNGKAFQKFRDLWYENRTPDFCQKCHYIDLEPIYNKGIDPVK